MASRKLCLSRTNRKIGGVCGGIAEYFGLDATLVRIITLILIFAVVIGFITGAGDSKEGALERFGINLGELFGKK